jgi:hypothetical protein
VDKKNRPVLSQPSCSELDIQTIVCGFKFLVADKIPEADAEHAIMFATERVTNWLALAEAEAEAASDTQVLTDEENFNVDVDMTT